MTNISKRYLSDAYKDAKEYANQFVELSETMSTAYIEKDKFYKEFKSKDYMLMILSFALGIVGFIVWPAIKGTLINVFVNGSMTDFIGLIAYLQVIYIFACIGLLLWGAWNVFLIYYATNAKREVYSVQNWCESIKQKVATLHVNYEKLEQELFTNPHAIQIPAIADDENNYKKFYDKIENIESETKKKRSIFLAVLFFVLFIAHFIFLGAFSLSVLQSSYALLGILEISWSYLLLLLLVYEFQIHMYEYLQKNTKLITVGVFLVYQAMMALVMMKAKMFAPVQGYKFLLAVAKLLGEGETSLASSGAIILIASSIATIIYISRTNIEKEVRIIKAGLKVPMTDGSERVLSTNQLKKGNIIAVVVATIYSVVGGFFMATILAQSFSFGGVVSYIVLTIIWCVVSGRFSNENNDAAYGKRIRCIRSAFFWCYIFITLSAVPNFGIGSIILLLLQWFLTAGLDLAVLPEASAT